MSTQTRHRPTTDEGRALLDHVSKWGVENAFGSSHTLETCILTIEDQARRLVIGQIKAALGRNINVEVDRITLKALVAILDEGAGEEPTHD